MPLSSLKGKRNKNVAFQVISKGWLNELCIYKIKKLLNRHLLRLTNDSETRIFFPYHVFKPLPPSEYSYYMGTKFICKSFFIQEIPYVYRKIATPCKTIQSPHKPLADGRSILCIIIICQYSMHNNFVGLLGKVFNLIYEV